jgi:hypothetical protein
MSDILYRPNLKPDLNYQSQWSPGSEQASIDSNNDGTQNDDIKQLLESLKTMRTSVTGLPGDIGSAILVPIAGIEYVAGTIDEDNYVADRPTDKDISVVPVKQPDELPTIDNISFPDDIFSDTIIPANEIKVENNDKADVVRKQYVHDMVSIFNDYIDNLQIALNNYYTNMFIILTELEPGQAALVGPYYHGNANDIKNKNLQHISDSIITSQIVRQQKIKVFKKLFDIDETILHIRSCKVASELKARYFGEEFGDTTTMLDMNSNQYLSESRMVYEKKYEENFLGLYKYLNSSVILINECLQMHLKETQCKAILVKKEGLTK